MNLQATSEERQNALSALELALLDYVERYGLTPKARAALDALEATRPTNPDDR